MREPFQIQKNSSPSSHVSKYTTASETDDASTVVTKKVFPKRLCFYSNIAETNNFFANILRPPGWKFLEAAYYIYWYV